MLFIIYCLLFCICLIGFKVVRNGFKEVFLSIPQCNVVKGLFIILVFISHINQYIKKTGFIVSSFGDILYFKITGSIGQLMVVMFLFFSGYGIMESFKKKGADYVSTMPQKRILTTLLNFDVAVLFYIALNVLLGKSMAVSQVFLSFIAWDTVGNSNWYIFVILVCYTLSYLILEFCVRCPSLRNDCFFMAGLIVPFVMTVICLSFLKASWWYNTLLCFPLGMVYSQKKEMINRLVQSNYYACLLFVIVIFFVFGYMPVSGRGIIGNIESMAFAIFIILIMMKMDLNNKYLQWMGKNLFPIYIYQRLMMFAIYEIPDGKFFIASYPILFILICFLSVILIAWMYPKWQVSVR